MGTDLTEFRGTSGRSAAWLAAVLMTSSLPAFGAGSGNCADRAPEASKVRAVAETAVGPAPTTPAEATNDPPAFIKGWIEAARGVAMGDLPAGTRVIDFYEERLFVEIPSEVIASLWRRGLRFEAIEDADLFTIGAARFDVRGGEPPLPLEWRAHAGATAGERPYLVKFDAPVKPEWLAELEAAGARLVQYQPQFGYLIFARGDIKSRLRDVGHLAFTGEYHAAYKAYPGLKAKASRDETITLRLVLFDLPGWEASDDALIARGARLVDLSEGPSTSQWQVLHHAVIENVHSRDLPGILSDPAVYWAEEWFPPAVEGEQAAQITAGNLNASNQPVTGYYAWLAGLGADGAGVTVAVADTGLDTGNIATLHEDLRGRTTFATALCAANQDTDGHGTNVASITLGDPRLPNGTGLTDPNGFYWGSGSAPAAALYFQKALNDGLCPASYAGMPNTLAPDAVRFGGAEIGTHSFTDGATPGNGYTSTAQAWDARVRDGDPNTAGNQPYAVLFSAGNSGPASGTLTSPHAAKNIVTIGATENYRPSSCPGVSGCGGPADDVDALVDFSSRGPTVDSRIKPDVCLPGHVIAGARSSAATYDCFCDPGGGAGCCASVGVGSSKYSIYSGTSQASPRAAGASAVVFDWFEDLFGVFPSPAMNKAILINGAVDMKAPDVPNNNEGWGRVNLKNSFDDPSGTRFVDQTTIIGAIGDPGAFAMNYFVQDPTKPLKASLVWTDAPGAVSCNPCLVNDLDLFLAQGATTWRGNNFTNGLTNTGSTPDNRNNVEGIHLAGSSLTCASFQIKVRATTLGGDGVPGNADTTDQDFALVIANAATSTGPPRGTVSSSSVGGGCDSDVFLDRRETADLTLVLKNAGCAAAAGVQATVSVDSAPPGASLTVSPSGAETIGDIAVGASVPHAWQLELADSASSFCGQRTRLRVDLTDAASHAWTEFVEVILDTNSFTPVTETDPATVDLSFSHDTEWSLRPCRTTSAPTSWHMGDADCAGIPRDTSTRDLVFDYTVGTGDVIKELSFKHLFNGYSNASFNDSVRVEIDPENDGSFVTLQTWRQGIDNPTDPNNVLKMAGPYDLTPFNVTRSNTIKIRFRFQSAANWIGGPNNAAGWDVDDIVFKFDQVVCDTGACPVCAAPTGLTNNLAADADACLTTGVLVSWAQDAGAWGDSGTGARSHVVLRGGLPITSGGCNGPIVYGTLSCTDDTAPPGSPLLYQVRYANGCGLDATTTGAPATDGNCAPPPVDDGGTGGTPLDVVSSGSGYTLTWSAAAGASRYNIYVGTIGTWYSHGIFTAVGLDGADSCFEPATSATFDDPAPGTDLYFLVASDNGIAESQLGEVTPPLFRPYASLPCSPH